MFGTMQASSEVRNVHINLGPVESFLYHRF